LLGGSLAALLAASGCLGGEVGPTRRLGDPGPIAAPAASQTPAAPMTMPLPAPAPPVVPEPLPGPPASYPESVLCPEARIESGDIGLSPAFAAQCAGCHGGTGEGRGPFPSLHKGRDAAAFVSVVRSGRNQMPPFDETAAPEARLLRDFAALQRAALPGDPAAPAPAADPACGPGRRELPAASAAERAARIERGLAAYRKPGPKGACAGCHSAVAIDLAFIGFSDADILRRAIPQVGVTDARAIVDLVHALRADHGIDRPLHPRRFRFLQPGDEVLAALPQPSVYPGTQPGEQDAARDAAFARSLKEEVRLLLLGDPIRTVDQARAAETQLLGLDLGRLRVGIPLERWTEDGFHGAASNVATEWVPMLARRPAPGRQDEFEGLAEAYRRDPTDANLWRLYDAIETLTVADGPALAARWSLRKYQALQVASHMLLHRTRKVPDPFAGAGALDDPAARRALAIARNPFWRVGDAVRQNPLNCNQPDPCTTFPPELDATFTAGNEARERQSYEDKLSWFWLGFSLDPALVVTEDSLATVSGDYFLALTQPWYQVHNAFVVAMIATAKANARSYQDLPGAALRGHGRWASPRPFLAFKHSERELHHPPRLDLRYPIHERLWANAFRMFLLLMNDELARTGQVFDRARTLENVAFMRRWFGQALEVGRDHADLDALVAQLQQRLTGAREIGVVGAGP
jgi:mono/diheme cytochrome c family protein